MAARTFAEQKMSPEDAAAFQKEWAKVKLGYEIIGSTQDDLDAHEVTAAQFFLRGMQHARGEKVGC